MSLCQLIFSYRHCDEAFWGHLQNKRVSYWSEPILSFQSNKAVINGSNYVFGPPKAPEGLAEVILLYPGIEKSQDPLTQGAR